MTLEQKFDTQTFINANPLLNQADLAQFNPDFGTRFSPPDADPNLLIVPGTIESLGQYQSVILAWSGPSTAGKDIIAGNILTEFGDVWRITTHVTRPPREGAVDLPYAYVSEQDFQTILDQGGYAEVESKGGYRYGTPVAEIQNALDSKKSIILWPGAIGKVPEFRLWLADHHPQIPLLSIFILPYEMPFNEYAKRIAGARGGEEAQWRTEIAANEIILSGSLADILILNPPDPSGIPHDAITATRALFSEIILQRSSSAWPEEL